MLNTAIILAGGFGTRLKDVIVDLPKPMAPVNGRPFLDYQLDYLGKNGITKVCLSVGHLSQKIISHYGSAYKGIELSYAIEQEPLGTGGGIRLALENMAVANVLVLNGDSFFELDILAFYTQHINKNSNLSIALRNVANASRYGAISINHNNQIISFKEKSGVTEPGYINAGVYIIERELFVTQTKSEQKFSVEKDFFEKRLTDLRIMGFVFDAYFIDIGVPEDYMKAQNDFKGFKY